MFYVVYIRADMCITRNKFRDSALGLLRSDTLYVSNSSCKCMANFGYSTHLKLGFIHDPGPGSRKMSIGATVLKKSFYVANIVDIPSISTPVCSPSSPLSHEPSSISLSPLLAELAYLWMLFILQPVCTASNANQLHNKQT